MEPRIQYAKTKDGVSIAFWTLGEGEPLVHMPAGFSHIQAEWQQPEIRSYYERLAEKRMLIRYDGRGSGLSDRDITDYSLDARVRDLNAVVNRLSLENFALWATHDNGPAAVVYAGRQSERVTHLVLWCTYARTSDPPWAKALDAMMTKDWEMATETIARGAFGWSAEEPARWFAEFLRQSLTPEAMYASFTAADDFDVTDLLAEVRAPTLVLHRAQNRVTDLASARVLASGIADARLLVLEGETPLPWLEDSEAVVAAIYEFLGEGEEAAAKPALTEPGAFRTVLFTDVEGSTALTDRLGDAKARELLREHERTVREALKAHGGSEVKTMGDGFMASFSSATKALECAIAMQRAFAHHNESTDEPILVRIGLNAGEPITEDDDLFGTAVNEAARITAVAKGGEILVANVVRELAKGKDFLFADRGETALKGFEDPVRLYEVRWEE